MRDPRLPALCSALAALVCAALALLLTPAPARADKPPVAGAGAVATPTPGAAALARLWSDPATWNGRPPATGSDVLVPPGVTVVLDVNTPRLGNVLVRGTLRFARRDLELTARRLVVMAGGTLEVGTEARPFLQRAVITLTGTPADGPFCAHSGATDCPLGMDVGTKVLASMDGRVELHGAPRTSWTRLGATVRAGESVIVMSQPTDWRPGDRLVLAPTDFDPFEAEVRTVVASDGVSITLDRPLAFTHWGRTQTVGAHTLEMRAEVGLLNRNVLVRGEPGADPWFGGHTMFMGASRVRISNVEFALMGQAGLLGRYPVHFHFGHDSMTGSYLRSSSIHGSVQRGVVIHRTNALRIEGNVVYDTRGHQYFLESATEMRNELVRNLGVLTRRVLPEHRNDPVRGSIEPFGDGSGRMPGGAHRWASFWLSNAHNRVVGNAAAGVEHGHGFWLVHGARHRVRDADVFMPYPEDVNVNAGEPERWDYFYTSPYHRPMLEFRDNVAHTVRQNLSTGLDLVIYFFHNVGSGFSIDVLPPTKIRNWWSDDRVADPATVHAPFLNNQAWKCTNAGLWTPFTPRFVVRGSAFAECRVSILAPEQLGHRMWVEDTLLMGRTENNPPGRHPRQVLDLYRFYFGVFYPLERVHGTVGTFQQSNNTVTGFD